MASALCFLLVLLPLSFPFFVAADKDLIQKTCQGTQYPDLCISIIGSDPSSINADTKGLVGIVVRKAKETATDTHTYLSNEVLKNGTKPEYQKVAKLCVDKYSNASAALERSLQDIASDNYDFAAIETAAAGEYEKACHTEFIAIPGLTYPVELAQREVVLDHLCVVAVAILDQIPNHDP